MQTRPWVQALLEEGTRYAPHYRPSMNSDHLPMTVVAMAALGATEQQVGAFRNSYIVRLHQWQEPGQEIDDWQPYLGNSEAYPALLAFFNAEIAAGRLPTLLHEVLARTLPSLAMEAFHPLIRLGYGVDAGSPAEIAAGLAYLVAAHETIPSSDTPLCLQEMVDTQAAGGDRGLNSGRFGPSVLALAASGRYPTGSAEDLREIAAVALRLYQSTRNFFALHLVTATQALRVAVPQEMASLAVASMTGALLASHLVLGSPKCLESVLPVPARLDPEHAFKYAWACWSEYEAYGDEAYLSEIRGFREAGLVPAWAGADLVFDAN